MLDGNDMTGIVKKMEMPLSSEMRLLHLLGKTLILSFLMMFAPDRTCPEFIYILVIA
jgi:hypothetical protein